LKLYGIRLFQLNKCKKGFLDVPRIDSSTLRMELKNIIMKDAFLYEYLSDKLERNDNRDIAKEQLKFNFKSSAPSTDNKN